jgi:tape measure domain-containing protein
MPSLKIDLIVDDKGQVVVNNAKMKFAELETAVNKTGSSMENFAKYLGPLSGIASAGAVAALAKDFLDANLAMERINATMAATSKSSAGAVMNIAFVRDESKRLGMVFQDTATAYAKFMASTRNTPIEGEPARKVFSGVSEAATALKLSGDEANGIFLALSQMMSKGKVSAEELSGQLGERLPGAVRLTAQAMGLTTAELLKQMQDGKLMAADVLPKLAEQLHKTYGEAATKAADSGQAAINRFNNALFETKVTLTQDLMPEFSKFLNMATKALPSIGPALRGALRGIPGVNLPFIASDVYDYATQKKAQPPSVWDSFGAARELTEEKKSRDDAKKVEEEAARKTKAAEEAKKAQEKYEALFKNFEEWRDRLTLLNPELSETDRKIADIALEADKFVKGGISAEMVGIVERTAATNLLTTEAMKKQTKRMEDAAAAENKLSKEAADNEERWAGIYWAELEKREKAAKDASLRMSEIMASDRLAQLDTMDRLALGSKADTTEGRIDVHRTLLSIYESQLSRAENLTEEMAAQEKIAQKKLDIARLEVDLLQQRGTFDEGAGYGLRAYRQNIGSDYQQGAEYATSIAEGARDTFKDIFFDSMRMEWKTAADYADGFLRHLQNALADLASKKLMAAILGGSESSSTGLLGMGLSFLGGIMGLSGSSSGNLDSANYSPEALAYANGGIAIGGTVYPRAAGGAVDAYSVYWTGERGPEPFVASRSGYMVSHADALRALKGAGAGGLTINKPMYFNNAIDARTLSVIDSRIDQAARTIVKSELGNAL